MTKPTVLLTGANGFIGSHLIEALLKYEYTVVVLKRSTSNLWRIKHLLNKFKCYDINEISFNSIFELEKIDIVVHLATLYSKFDNGNEVPFMMDSNIKYPTEILEAGVRSGIKGFINTGTFFEYDCRVQPVSENAPIKAFNFYAKTKIAFESILKTYSNDIAINTFRLFSPYGEKDNQKIIPMIIQKAIKNENIDLSEGLQKIDLIYIKDIVSVYIKAIERMADESVNPEYEVFNLGTGVALSIRDIVSIVEQCFGRNIKKTWGENVEMNIPIVYADIAKLKKYFNWTPEYDAMTGIEKTVSYYKKEFS